jgi:hypothetical protein
MIGAAVFLQAALGRILFSADAARVYFLGHRVLLECGLRARYGLPCPTCGMTRSVVMALHGDWAAAWGMAPGGVAAVAGILLFGCAAWALAVSQWSRNSGWEAWLVSGIRRWAPLYGVAATLVWLAGWVVQFHAALEMR